MARQRFWHRISRYADQSLARRAGPFCASRGQVPPQRTMDLAVLEDRVLFSATPLGAAVDADASMDIEPQDLSQAADASLIYLLDSPHQEFLTTDSLNEVTGPDRDTKPAGEIPSPHQSDDDAAQQEDESDPAARADLEHVDSDGNTESDLPLVEVEPTAEAIRHELVFVDTSASNYQQLLENLWSQDDPQRQFEVVLIASEIDGVEQITNALAERDDLDAIHIVSHGTDGALQLGSELLRTSNLDGHTDQLAEWGGALAEDADLLFYGCNLAATAEGRVLMDQISNACDCDVGASDDATGLESLGSNWGDDDYVAAKATKVDDPGQLEGDDALAFANTPEFAANVANTVTNTNSTNTNNGGGPTDAIKVADNSAAFTTETATDPELDTSILNITGGADQGLFSIGLSSDVPAFVGPADLGSDHGQLLTQSLARLTGDDVAAGPENMREAEPAEDELLPLTTSDGHVLGFSQSSILVAAPSHLLHIELVGANLVNPDVADATASTDTAPGAAQTFTTVTYAGLWDGVSAVYDSQEDAILKSTYYVDAYAGEDAAYQIRLHYSRDVSLDEPGSLVIAYENGTMVDSAPVAWQDIGGQRIFVDVEYRLLGDNEVGFSVGDYNHSHRLVIDATLTWNTFLAAAGDDQGRAIVQDDSDNVYVGGSSNASWGSPVNALTGDYVEELYDSPAAEAGQRVRRIWDASVDQNLLGLAGVDPVIVRYHHPPNDLDALQETLDTVPDGGGLLWDAEPWHRTTTGDNEYRPYYYDATPAENATLFGEYATTLAAVKAEIISRDIDLWVYAAPMAIWKNQNAIRSETTDAAYITWKANQATIIAQAETSGMLDELREMGGRIALNTYVGLGWDQAQYHSWSLEAGARMFENLHDVGEEYNVPHTFLLWGRGTSEMAQAVFPVAAPVGVMFWEGPGATENISQLVAAWLNPEPFTPQSGALLISTDSNVGAPGADGLPSGWGEDQILEFSGVDLTYGAATDGDLSVVMDFDPFALDATDLGALHYVSRDIIVGGGANTFNLLQGDLLVSFHQDETILAAYYETGSDTLVHDQDLLAFRPTTPGDYFDGTFYMLLDDVVPTDLRGISLVERATTVGDARLGAGTFIIAQETAPAEDIYHFVPTGVGAGPKTSGTLSTLIDGTDIKIDASVVRGLELIETTTLVGGQVLPAGSILVSLRDNEPEVGDNNLATARQDIFWLEVTATGLGATAADAYMFLDGSDVFLDESPGTENPYAIALINGPELVVDTAADVLDAPDASTIAALLADKGVDGKISLREALTATNGTTNGAAPDQIHFAIAGAGPHVIQLDVLLGALPAIVDPVLIDGSTEPDYIANTPVVRIDGNNLSGSLDGFALDSTSDGTTIRGLMITRMPRHGIYAVSGADNITIAGNWIGTDGSASPLLGNANDGIELRGASATLGGVGPNDRNVITNSGDEGINLVGTGVSSHLVQGNYIGINADGTAGSGNNDVGIAIISGSGNMIGGNTVAAGNVISNNSEGIEINTDNNIVRGNFIGTDPTGLLNRGNRSDDGVEIQSGAIGNRIGGILAGEGNLIAFNALAGVNVFSGTGNTVLGNQIHSNSGLGINLDSGGVDLNDAGDGDSGGNNLLNFPVIYTAVISGGNVTITGEARPGATVEFFESDSDGSGHGEGESFLGRNTVSGSTPGTDDASARQFSFVVAVGSLLAGDEVTATATDAGNNTSEFSLNVTSTTLGNVPPVIGLPGGPLNYTENNAPAVIDPGSTVIDADLGNFAAGTLTVDFTVGATSNDVLSILVGGNVTLSGSSVRVSGTPVGTFAGGASGTALVITWNTNSSPATAQEVLRQIAYSNTSENPSTAARTVRLVLTDGDGGTSTAVTETINVAAVNNEESLDVNLPLSLNEGATAAIGASILSTSDPDNTALQLLYTVTTAPVHGTLLLSGLPTATFTQDDIDNNRLGYQHNGSETTSDSFDFTVDDGTGTSTSATLLINVSPVNDSPMLAVNTGTTVGQGATTTITVLQLEVTDVDHAAGQLAYTVTTLPANGQLELATAPGLPIAGFTQHDVDNNRLVYVHDGSPTVADSLALTFTDGVAAPQGPVVFNVVVAGVNAPPTAGNDFFVVTAETSLNVSVPGVSINDADPESSPLTVNLVTGPVSGVLTLNANGSFDYTPNAGFAGSDAFQYQANDGVLNSNVATVTITVLAPPTPAPEPPAGDPPPENDPAEEELPADPPVEDAEGEEKPEDPLPPLVERPSNGNPRRAAPKSDGPIEGPLSLELPVDPTQFSAQLLLTIESVEAGNHDDALPSPGVLVARGVYDGGLNFESRQLWGALDTMGNEIEASVAMDEMVAGAAKVMGTTFTIGWSIWAVRGGYLAAGMLSSLPSWQFIDPLPIFDAPKIGSGDRPNKHKRHASLVDIVQGKDEDPR